MDFLQIDSQEYKNKLNIFADLEKATYHLIRGSEIMNNDICSESVPCLLTELITRAKRLTANLEPIIKQIDSNLDTSFIDKG